MSESQMRESAELIKAVDQKIEKVRTRSLDLSFNELLDMYDAGELIIMPEYQRLFRWSEGAQSRFIESLILEMPVPPIFVIEKIEGEYELIDGLQRISSYLHFRGKLRDPDDETKTRGFLQLVDCDIVPELNGMTYKDLPKALEIKLKRNFIRVEIIRKESDSRLRYYMFKRLNTGGETLSEQEIRNCTIRLLNDRFNNFIISLAENKEFLLCIANLSDEKKAQKADEELVLRFFAFKNWRDRYRHDVAEFLTEYMEKVSDPALDEPFDYNAEKACFEKTFAILAKTLGEHAFSGVNEKGTFVTRFLAYHYEAFTLGIQPVLDRIDPDDADTTNKLTKAFKAIKRNEEFRRITTGGGKDYRNPLNDRITFVAKELMEALA